ncbi:TPA: ferredoxin [Candidatus Sumerlaeota bacterium]|nr:ferredoxin [Candidatus Sumerlaeota bacterium]
MPKVKFLPQNVIVEVPVGVTLLEAARQTGIDVESPCNGAGTCEKCKVRVLYGKTGEEQTSKGSCSLPKGDRLKGWVLACHATVTEDLGVETPKVNHNEHQILSTGQAHKRQLRPWINKIYDSTLDFTRTYAGERVISEHQGDTTDRTYGLAVDIGTTTLVVALVDLLTGRELGAVSAINPQTVFGHDVLSRIQFAGEGDGLKILQERLIAELNRMTTEVAARHEVHRDFIYEAVLSGNTTMLHLAVGADPRSLGRYPYTPVIRGGNSFPASQIGLRIAPEGEVYLPPIFDGFVGADITAGALVTELDSLDGITLFVDVGTNGEMILAVHGKLYATSTAAGPAFEGMNISCGMRAAEGAIEVFLINDNGHMESRTIGNAPAVGICGSGLVDIVGELVARGIIEKTGRFSKKPRMLGERLVKVEGSSAFALENDVYLTQKDVRQVQLAKGAIRAGIDTLLKFGEIAPEQVDRVLIAGSFGYHLRPQSLINLGLLPAAFDGKIDFVGNTSKSGAQAFLLDRVAREEINTVVQNTPSVDLAHAPDFEKVFVDALSFPEPPVPEVADETQQAISTARR